MGVSISDIIRAIDDIKRQVAIAAYERDVWFPLNIAMPRPYDNVLITDGDGYIRHCYLDELGKFRTCEEGMSVERVKAWRPLPEPFEEGE